MLSSHCALAFSSSSICRSCCSFSDCRPKIVSSRSACFEILSTSLELSSVAWSESSSSCWRSDEMSEDVGESGGCSRDGVHGRFCSDAREDARERETACDATDAADTCGLLVAFLL